MRLLNGGVKTTGNPTSPRHAMRPVNANGFRTKATYRGPTDSGGKGGTGYHSPGSNYQGFTGHSHHGR